MPFDMNPMDPDIDQLARMELLGEIAAQAHGAQSSYNTCFWYDVRTHPVARAIVAEHIQWHGGPRDEAAVARLFGMGTEIWSGAPISEKREWIRRAIEKKKAKIARQQKVTA